MRARKMDSRRLDRQGRCGGESHTCISDDHGQDWSADHMLSLYPSRYDVDYLTSAVGSGSEYYLSATGGGGGEPPGYWAGQGAKDLGLSGDVDPDTMKALYEQNTAPDGSVLGRAARKFNGMRESLDERVEARGAAEAAAEGPYVTPERISQLRNMIRSRQRSSVRFYDFTWSAPKSMSVAHAGYLAAAKQARETGDGDRAAWLEAHAGAIIGAVRDAARTVVQEIERTACYTRTGHHGSGEGDWRDGRGITAAV